jgi:hypothetical protein
MDIELVNTEESPLKTLLNYLRENIYSKMSKKDQESLFKGSLEGDLMKAINKFYISQRFIDFNDTWNKHSEAMKYQQAIIWRLQNGTEQTESDKRGYGKGKYMGD